jgi:prolycopene isomerase
MHYGCKVVSLEPAGGRICSARLEDGTRVEADYFVYSGTVWNLYQKLLPSEAVPPALARKVAAMVPTPSSIVLYATVGREAFPPDIGPIEMLVDDTSSLAESEITLYIPTIDDPSLNEPGSHSVLAIGPSFRTWPAPKELASGNPEILASYEAAKGQEAERIIGYLSSYFPNFRTHLKYWEIGSPLTISPSSAIRSRTRARWQVPSRCLARTSCAVLMPKRAGAISCCAESPPPWAPVRRQLSFLD